MIKAWGLSIETAPLEKSKRYEVIMITNHLSNRTVFFFPNPELPTYLYTLSIFLILNAKILFGYRKISLDKEKIIGIIL